MDVLTLAHEGPNLMRPRPRPRGAHGLGAPQRPSDVLLTLEATSCSCGTTAVWTRFPFTTRRISMESVVKARRYGKAHTARQRAASAAGPLAGGSRGARLSHSCPHCSGNFHLPSSSGCFSSSSPGTSPASKRDSFLRQSPLSCQASASSW